MSDCAGLARRFLVRHPEKGELNQYWYSEGTLASVVDEILSSGCDRVAFLSTPSVFFCLPKGSAVAENARLFDVRAE